MSESRIEASLPLPVKASAHWRVILSPHVFQKYRIPTLKECWALMESCRVSLRGWDYPHVDLQNRENGNDWIASWCEFMGHREYWRFYQSGQFIHLFSFREDFYGDKPGMAFRGNVLGVPNGFSPSGYVEIIQTLYIITEVFEFAERLAQKDVFGSHVSVVIEMTGIKDRVLFFWDPFRHLYNIYKATQETLSNEWRLETQGLLADSAELARQATVWFYERFGWMEAAPELLRSEQQKLLEGKL